MQITQQWLDSIADEKGLTKGQVQLLTIWQERQAFVGYGYLPDQVAHFIGACKGYRGMSEELKNILGKR